MKNNFYTYVYIDPRNGMPFYVGKGKNNRCDIHLVKIKGKYHINKHFQNKVWQIWNEGLEPIIRKVYNGSEDFSLIIEEKLIENFKKEGIKLCNLTNGGEGVSGHKHTEETKNKLRKPHTEETKNKLRDLAIKQFSNLENRKKMSEIKKKQYENSPELRKKVSISHIGHVESEETKLKRKKICKTNKTVIQYDIKGNKINQYFSIKDAGRKLKINCTLISNVCKYRAKTAVDLYGDLKMPSKINDLIDLIDETASEISGSVSTFYYNYVMDPNEDMPFIYYYLRNETYQYQDSLNIRGEVTLQFNIFSEYQDYGNQCNSIAQEIIDYYDNDFINFSVVSSSLEIESCKRSLRMPAYYDKTNFVWQSVLEYKIRILN